MLSINLTNTSKNADLFVLATNGRAFCCLIEVHPYAVYRQKEDFLLHLNSSVRTSSMHLWEAENLPILVLQSLEKELVKISADSSAVEPCFACAVSLTKDQVQVSWAGEMRSHLVENGILSKVTRIHNFVEDTPNGVPQNFPISSIKEYQGVVTRGLGVKRSEPPETAVWLVKDDYTFVLCTSQVHQYRKPEEYIQQIETSGRTDKHSPPIKLTGTFASIGWKSS